MGQFSWLTSDTGEQILEQLSDHGIKQTVYLLQPGDLPSIREDNYEGYGVFGGIDAMEWLARINGAGIDRNDGITLQYSGRPLQFPLKFSFDSNAVYEDLDAAVDDPNQGWLTEEEDYDY
jgi:hypothetical protein